MTWVNLNDVYVSKSGGTISGDLAVNGTLTINDKTGNGTTYDVASQISTLRDSVSQVNGWNVFHFGKFCICSCIWKASSNATITNTWGNIYESEEEFTCPNYPVTFTSTPASSISYIAGDSGASFAALVERNSNSSTTSAGSFWLIRPNSGYVIGHPRIAVIAAGWV